MVGGPFAGDVSVQRAGTRRNGSARLARPDRLEAYRRAP